MQYRVSRIRKIISPTRISERKRMEGEVEGRHRNSKRNTRTSGTCMLVRASLQNGGTRVFSQHLHVHRARRVRVTFSCRTYLCCHFTLRRAVAEIGTTLPLFPLSNYTLPVLGNYTVAPGFSVCRDDNPRSQMIIRHVQRLQR